jgi:ketosteroid isomerase-like protein
MSSSAISTVIDFISRINAHDPRGLVNLMTDTHRFIDSLGVSISGKAAMLEAWGGYFLFFPDYAMESSLIMEQGDEVAVFATVRGTLAVGGKLLKENAWEIPAACKAIVKDGKIDEWRVYADNEPVRTIIALHNT